MVIRLVRTGTDLSPDDLAMGARCMKNSPADPRHVLVTGATGFVGAAIVVELLAQHPSTTITCLVREKPGTDPVARVQRHLLTTLDGYDRPDLRGEVAERVGVLVGDVTDPDLAARAEQLDAPIEEVWHAAASLRYRDRDAEEIRAHNVEGTRHVLALARAAGAHSFNHVSTAYVAGRRGGVILEGEVPDGTEPNNQYERSKIDGEALVAASGLHHRIFRPSIVIGHSGTMIAESDAGVYGFLREMQRFVSAVGDPSTLPALNIAAHVDTGLNLIPVDLVASSAVAIAASSSDAHYFHLTNGHTALVRDAIPMVCELLGLPSPNFVDDMDSLTAKDRLVNRLLDFYLPYLGGERIFDRTNAEAVVSDRLDHVIDPPEQRRIAVTYLDSVTTIPETASAHS